MDDDVLARIEDRLLMLRCNPQTDNVEVLIECIGALAEEIRRLRAVVEPSPSSRAAKGEEDKATP